MHMSKFITMYTKICVFYCVYCNIKFLKNLFPVKLSK